MTAYRALLVAWVLILVPGGVAFAQQKPAQPPAPQVPVPSGVAPAPQQKGAPPIQVTTRLVHLVATVTDRHHDLVTNLDQSDFKVSEDGVPQQIRFFGRETDLPLRIGMLLDTSNSIRDRLEFEQDAAIDFLDSVIRHNKDDRAFLMTFDNEPEVIQDYTGDLDQLSTAIRAQRAGGGTALNDAIVLASQKLLNSPPPKGNDTDVRRVMVLISDGDDNLSDHALSDAVESAIRAEASIYCISTNTEWLSTDSGVPEKYHIEAGDKVLTEFADQSGGRVFFPYKVEDLAQSFLDIGDELRSQYFIAYAPTNPATDGKYRTISVTTDRKGLTVRTRRGYYSTAGPAPAFTTPSQN
ncbi:MAG TPA: VWA domain-containing protein [Verrucomicrobiae bacterium]|nr:VWA domain-containing protein [Verrucomicrobiae bacterium]